MNRVLEKERRRVRRKIRIRKRIFGTAARPRMTVFKSNRHMYVQVIDDEKGITLSSGADVEKDLKAMKPNVENAGKLGEIVGQRLKEKGVTAVVFDRNGYLYHGIVKAIADGVRKAGIQL